MTPEQIKQFIQGEWASLAPELRPSSVKSADGSIKPFYLTRAFKYATDDTFELDALKPGDLLFWAGTYNVDRDPAITHTMIYVGREKATNHRIMVGASDGRTYKGQSRFGVSIFDFKVSRLGAKSEDRPGPTFVGYGRIPGLRKE